MEILSWGYRKRYGIKAVFDHCPASTVFFRIINGFYFVYSVRWSEEDPLVERRHLEEMESLINKELGTDNAYNSRRSIRSHL